MGLDWLPGPALLTDEEISRLISVAVRLLGITEVRYGRCLGQAEQGAPLLNALVGGR